MADVRKGVISSINGNKATVVLGDARDAVSPALVVPWELIGWLNVNDAVVFVQFDDGTGIILARMDGEKNPFI